MSKFFLFSFIVAAGVVLSYGPASADSWDFAVFGDTRGDSFVPGVNTDAVTAIATDISTNQNVDFVLSVGDASYGALTASVLQAQFQAFKTAMSAGGLKLAGTGGSGISYYPVRGNHEYMSQPGTPTVWQAEFGSSLPQNGPTTASGGGGNSEVGMTYSFIHYNASTHSNDALILALDEYTNQPGGTGDNEAQPVVNQAWVDRQLAANPGLKVFTFGHVSAYQVNHTDDLAFHPNLRDTFLTSLFNAGEVIYFAGHDHSNSLIRVYDGNPATGGTQRFYQAVIGGGGAPAEPFNGTYNSFYPNDYPVTGLYHDDDPDHGIAFYYGYGIVTVDDNGLWLKLYGSTSVAVPDFQLRYTMLMAGTMSVSTGSLSGNINNDATLQFDQATDGTYAGVISGTGEVVKKDAGALTFSGANTYTGATAVNNGTLNAGVATQAFGVDSAVTVSAGATLGLNNFDETIGSLAGDGTVTNGGAADHTLTAGADNTSTIFSGVIQNGAAGKAGLTKEGTGTLTLTGANTYTGTTTISAGVLSIAKTSSLPGWDTNGRYSVANGAALAVGNDVSDANIATITGTTNFQSGANLGFDTTDGDRAYIPAITDIGIKVLGLVKIGDNTLALSGTNSYTGVTTIDAGTISIGTIGDGGVAGNLGAATNAAENLVFNGGTLKYTGADAGTNRNFTINTGSIATIQVTAGRTLTMSGASTATTGGLTKTGDGTLRLGGANLYTGDTIVSAGTLALGNNLALQNSALDTSGAGVADVTGFTTPTFGGLKGSRALTSVITTGYGSVTALKLNPGTGATDTYSGAIVDGVTGMTLTKSGLGTQVLSGANTYTGTTTISAGVLSIAKTSSLPGWDTNGRYSVANGAALAVGNDVSDANIATITGTTNFQSGANLGFDTTDGDRSYGNAFSGALGLVKIGANTLILSGANTYAGATTVSVGTLQAGAANTFSSNSAVTVGDAGTLDLNGFSNAIGSLAGAANGMVTNSSATTAATLTAGGDNTTTDFSGVIQDGAIKTTGLTKTGTGTLTLSGANTYSGATTVSVGTLRSGLTNAFSMYSAVTMDNTAGAILDLNGFSNIIGSLNGGGTSGGNISLGSGTLTTGALNTADSYAGVISGPGGLTKVGMGTQILSGVNTYTGVTTLSAGTISVAMIGNGGVPGNLGAATNAAGNLLFNGGTVEDSGGTLEYTGATASTNRNFTIDGESVATVQVDAAGTILTMSGASTATTGGLTKTGAGTLLLGGANLYTGVTTLSAGTIGLGAAEHVGASGPLGNSAAGNPGSIVLSGGYLQYSALNQNDYSGRFSVAASQQYNVDTNSHDVTWATALTSSGGSLTKMGSGILTLSGANTYAGATTVNAGTLQAGVVTQAFGNGSAVTVAAGATLDLNNFDETIGSLSGAAGAIVTNSGPLGKTLTVGTDNTSTTFAGVINNVAGISLTKVGTGTLALSGANTYTGGATTINAGTLQVSNASALGAGAVTNNATLDVGTTDLTLGAGSVYTQNAGSTLKLTANSSSSFGKITSNVAATTAAGSIVTVTVGDYIPTNTALTIIDTGGAGIAGNIIPATINSLNPSVGFSAAISGNNLVLTATRSGSNSFSGVASNSNAAAVGSVFDNITNPSSDMMTVLNALSNSSASQIASSENSMTPTTDGGVNQSSTAMLNQFVNNMETHLENIRTTSSATGIATGDDYLNGIDIWAQGLGDYAHQDPRGSSNGYNATSWGVSGGADKSLYNDQIRVGISLGYGQTFVRSKDFSGRTDIDSIPGTIYCDYADNNLPFYIDAAFTFIYNTYNGSRQVTAGPTITRTANADYSGEQYSGYVEGGYSFFYKKLGLTPLVSFQYAHLHTGSYTETGANALNLSVGSQDYDMAQTGLGAKLACPFEQKYGTLTPDLHFKWLYDWIGDNQATTAGFAGGGTSFATNGFSPAQSAYDFGAKLDFKTKYNVTIGLDYDFLFKEDYYEHYGTVNVKYSF